MKSSIAFHPYDGTRTLSYLAGDTRLVQGLARMRGHTGSRTVIEYMTQ